LTPAESSHVEAPGNALRVDVVDFAFRHHNGVGLRNDIHFEALHAACTPAVYAS
jgi:hypothetical protein